MGCEQQGAWSFVIQHVGFSSDVGSSLCVQSRRNLEILVGLNPTAQISLLDDWTIQTFCWPFENWRGLPWPTKPTCTRQDLDEKDADGQRKYKHLPAELQHAQQLFASIPDVFELRGTMRFKAGDPLIELLQCMRGGCAVSKFEFRWMEHLANRTAASTVRISGMNFACLFSGFLWRG